MKPVISLGIWAFSLALPAHALEGDTFRPFVSFSRYYDDNLFRLADNEAITIDGRRLVGPQADSYNVFNFGANVNWRIGRQSILARASKSLVSYSTFDSLDYDGSDYMGQWNWQLGNHLDGVVGVTESLSQSSFTDLNTSLAINNQRTIRNLFTNANWQFHPRWQVGIGLNEIKVINSDSSQLSNNFTEQAQELNLTWRTPKGTSVRTQLRVAEANYPNQEFGVVDNGYSQQELNVVTVWPYSGLFRFQGRLGYLIREHNYLSQRDFSGLTGRGSAEYFATGKTLLSLSLYRELGAVSEISSSYRLTSGVSLNASWAMTSKLTLIVGLSDETAEFKGDPGFLSFALPVREDNTQSASLSLSFEPYRSTVIGLGLQSGRRESNNVITNSDYKFNSLFANVRVDF